jgi:uncharacterized membrane-anchored protein
MKWIIAAVILALLTTACLRGPAETFGVIVPCCLTAIVVGTAVYVVTRTISEGLMDKWRGGKR